MNRPDQSQEKDLNSIGIFTLSKDEDVFKDKNKISLNIHIEFPKEVTIDCPEFNVKVITKRGVVTLFNNFFIEEKEDCKLMKFWASQEVPESHEILQVKKVYFMSFIDLCWFSGNEKVNKDLIPTASTRSVVNSEPGDLGWSLPSRFLDSFIDCAGRLNESFLSGTLEDAILYGPYLESK